MNTMKKLTSTAAAAVLTASMSFAAVANDANTQATPTLTHAEKVENAREAASCVGVVIEDAITAKVSSIGPGLDAVLQEAVMDATVKCIADAAGMDVQDIPQMPDPSMLQNAQTQEEFADAMAEMQRQGQVFGDFANQYIDQPTFDRETTQIVSQKIMELMQNLQQQAPSAPSM